jgi:hypothetical protein
MWERHLLAPCALPQMPVTPPHSQRAVQGPKGIPASGCLTPRGILVEELEEAVEAGYWYPLLAEYMVLWFVSEDQKDASETNDDVSTFRCAYETASYAQSSSSKPWLMMHRKADTSNNLRLPFVSYKRADQSRGQQQNSELVKMMRSIVKSWWLKTRSKKSQNLN